MKKLYLLLGAGAIMFTASATDLNVASRSVRTELPTKHSLSLPTASSLISSQNLLDGKNMKLRSVRKADSSTSVEGLWIFVMGDYYLEGAIERTINYIASFIEGDLWFQPTDDTYFPFYGTYDAQAQTITFKREFLGTLGRNYVYQAPYVYGNKSQELEFQTLTGSYNANAGILTFYSPDGDPGIAWPAYSDEAATQNIGFYDIFDILSATHPGSGGNDEDWTDLGNATFIDGWVMPGVGLNQFDYPYEVPLQQNKENQNLYRVVGPYHYGPLADYNETSETGAIIFDVTDPNHVVFEMSNAGFAFSDLGISTLYCYNQLGAGAVKYNMSPDELIAVLGNEIPYTTFKDGVVELSFIINEEGMQYDANFGYQGDPTGGYIWKDGNNNLVNMTARIAFPGSEVKAIASEENAPTEYYNMQGLKVTTPEKGQLLIMRKGSKSQKVIF